MKLEQYQIETRRTFAFRKETLSTEMTDMLHCAIGISTEVGELAEAFNKEKVDVINIGEEIADIMWYTSNLANFINFNIDEEIELIDGLVFLNEDQFINKLVVGQGNLLDIFKKTIFYGKELDKVKIKNVLCKIIGNCSNLANAIDFNLGDLLDRNIAKLRIRFPEKFTEELAENRNLNEERKALES